MVSKSETIKYIESHISQFVASINRLGGFGTSDEDVEKFISGQPVMIDISSARGIICTNKALSYIIKCATQNEKISSEHVDKINRVLSGKLGSSDTSFRLVTVPANGMSKCYPVCTSEQIDEMLIDCIKTDANWKKVNIVSVMLRLLPYKHANIRTALLTLDLVLLYQYGLFLDTRAIDTTLFSKLVEKVQTPSGENYGYELSNMLLSNLI